ncbi:winged helix DNA-binding domain-containing protein [Actinomycetospora lemnae]|uniref:Winged helix DNA-binding domain-containing protein n=1 Tax=Actinomycetospora lemnae TaxID=3019891 RepID=A0ABT5T190_9PSEU|nr:winged helix DNA-binding domain-containing protein [Actinomycetospora sp. DW7H6]MDD7968894.1 winged helix DNA-binding domain-containing protein [Actinomycetospora sp. DW7H6]
MSGRRVSEVGLLRLVALGLVAPTTDDVAAVVRHLGAVQAQDLPGALTSLALRTASRSREAVTAACDAGAVVRSWPMRGTLHLVPAEDLGWMLPLGTPRPRAQAVRRRGELGLVDADVDRARELALATVPATRAELFAAWEAAGLDPVKGRGYHLLAELASTGVLCFGPLRDQGDAAERSSARDGEPVIVDVARWIPSPRVLERDEALGEWARRYFRSHGPATRTDFARWTGIPMADVDTGIGLARPDLASMDVDGTEHLLDPAVPDRLAAHRRAALGVHLLPGFDEFVLGYAERGHVLAPDELDRIVPGGNGVFRPTIVHRGRIVGTWTAPRGRLEVTPFGTLDARTEAAVARAHARLP